MNRRLFSIVILALVVATNCDGIQVPDFLRAKSEQSESGKSESGKSESGKSESGKVHQSKPSDSRPGKSSPPGDRTEEQKRPGSAANGSAEVFREALESMPWYDKQRDDYRKYDPEEVKKRIPKEVQPKKRELSALPELFLRLVVITVLVVVLSGLVMFLIKLAKDRLTPRVVEPALTDVVHMPLLDSFAKDADIPLERDELAKRIEQLLSDDPRKVAVLIFLYALLLVSHRGLLSDFPHHTAREVVGRLRRMQSLDPILVDRFESASRQFEQALYGGRAPEDGLEELWQYWKNEALR